MEYYKPNIKFSKKYQWEYYALSNKDMNAWHKRLREGIITQRDNKK